MRSIRTIHASGERILRVNCIRKANHTAQMNERVFASFGQFVCMIIFSRAWLEQNLMIKTDGSKQKVNSIVNTQSHKRMSLTPSVLTMKNK
jgi:hypothetical protein